jgi:deazaflavin-dependent oxidoreductase (nitroreductase family)
MADDGNFNDKIIAEFRANSGIVGGYFAGQTLLLLHTVGVKSGAERVNPLVYQPVGDTYAIFGSAGGGPNNPQWYRNLLAHPDTTIEVGTDTIQVRARQADTAERAPIWAKQMSDLANFAGYEKTAAPREIPFAAALNRVQRR